MSITIKQFEQLRQYAHTVIDRMGGLDFVRSFDFTRAGVDSDEPTLWNVHACPCCFDPVWVSSRPSEEDGWQISDFDMRVNPFTPCGICAEALHHVSPSLADHLFRSATAHLLLTLRDPASLTPIPTTEEPP